MSTARPLSIAEKAYEDIKAVCPLAKPEDFFPNGKILSEEVIQLLNTNLANETEAARFSRKYLKEVCNIDINRGGILQIIDPSTGKAALYATYKNELSKREKRQDKPDKTHEAYALGEGSFGKVKLVQNLETGEWLALKVIKINKSLSPEKQAQAKNTIDWEAYFLDKLKEGFRETFTKKNAPSEAGLKTVDKMYVVAQLKRGKQLDAILATGNLPFSERIEMALKLLENLERLHNENIIHRDIKPGNIMYDPITKKISIVDLGLASEGNHLFTGLCGTAEYIAPEIWRAGYPNGEFNKHVPIVDSAKVYSAASDLFAMGRVLQDLFGIPDASRVFGNIAQAEIGNSFGSLDKTIKPDDFPKPIYDKIRKLVKQMILTDANKRPSVDALRRDFESVNLLLFPNLIKDMLTIDERFAIASQIFKQVQEIHTHSMVHRDLKPENFFYDAVTKKVTILNYDLVANMDSTQPSYSTPADVYDLGMLVKNIFCLDEDKENTKVTGLTDTQRFQLNMLVEKMTNQDPALRISLPEAEKQIQRTLERAESLKKQIAGLVTSHKLKAIINDTVDVSESTPFDIALQLSAKIRELHEKGSIYRDINDENIFFNPATKQVVLLDTGMVIQEGTSESQFIDGGIYTAPEIDEAKDEEEIFTYRTSSDIYSLGILFTQLFDLIDGSDKEDEQSLYNLVSAMSNSNPSARPSIQEVEQKLQKISISLFKEGDVTPNDSIKYDRSYESSLSRSRSSFFAARHSISALAPSPTRSLPGSEPASPTPLDSNRVSPAIFIQNELIASKEDIKKYVKELTSALDATEMNPSQKQTTKPLYEIIDKLLQAEAITDQASFATEFTHLAKCYLEVISHDWMLKQILAEPTDTLLAQIENVLGESPSFMRSNKLDTLNSLVTNLENELGEEEERSRFLRD